MSTGRPGNSGFRRLRFSTISSLLLTGGVVATNVYMVVRLWWDWLPTSWGFLVGIGLLGLGYLAHIVYLLLDMASSTGACNKLAGCKVSAGARAGLGERLE